METNEMRCGGVFYAVGIGPGDADMLTVQAVRIVERCAVLAYPQTAAEGRGAGHIALDAVSRLVALSEKVLVPVPFPMSRRVQEEDPYQKAAEQCALHLAEGRDVAFIALGDVSLYATAGRVLQRVRALGYGAVAVPGVSSLSAAACACALELASPRSPVTIIPGDVYYKEGRLGEALRAPGTKVLMKMNRHLQDCAELALQERGTEGCFLVQRCSLPGQRVLRGEELRRLDENARADSYLSVLIVME